MGDEQLKDPKAKTAKDDVESELDEAELIEEQVRAQPINTARPNIIIVSVALVAGLIIMTTLGSLIFGSIGAWIAFSITLIAQLAYIISGRMFPEGDDHITAAPPNDEPASTNIDENDEDQALAQENASAAAPQPNEQNNNTTNSDDDINSASAPKNTQ